MTNPPIDAVFAGEFLRRFHGTINAHAADAIASLCTEDVVWEDPAQTLIGRSKVLSFHRDGMCLLSVRFIRNTTLD